jgi:uncharacterized protein Yka (UPF0111/DUF47 family)
VERKRLDRYREAVRELKEATEALQRDPRDWAAAFQRVQHAELRCDAIRRELYNPTQSGI